MSPEVALLRVGWVLDRYKDCDSTVLRVLSAADLEAVEVLADMARRRRPAADRPFPRVGDRLF